MAKSKIEWTELTGHEQGSLKTAAKRIGMSVSEYVKKINNDLKWCSSCCRWLGVDNFNKDRSSGDGLKSKCKQCSKALWRRKSMKSNHERAPRIDGDKEQARKRINHDVELGIRPNPNDLYCSLCGHKGDDRRHEYHHHMGYNSDHHYDVIPVCTICHKKAEGDFYVNEN